MIQTGFNFKKIADFIKENLNVLILVPAFIGGIWQLIELMSISISYIRFFSISQIAPDGILILVFLLLAGASTMSRLFFDKIMPKEHKKNDDFEPKNEEEREKKRKKDIKVFSFLFVVTYIFGLTFFIYYLKDYNNLHSDGLIAISVGLVCSVCLHSCYNLVIDSKKEDFKFGNVLLLIFYILIAIHFSYGIHNSFLLTDNLDNIENVKCVLKEKYPNAKNEILYFNDKYIFIDVTDTLKLDKVTKKTTEKIHIMELEKLFKD